jgi:EmrB/QacA subfamily drug resistance transporter
MTVDPQLSKTLQPAECDWQPCPRELRTYVLIVAILGSSLAFVDTTAVAVALAAMRADLGASFIAMQWVVAGYALVLSAFLLLGGAAADAFGRWRTFRAGIAVFALASAACGLAPRTDLLIAARCVQGLAAAVMVPGALALIATNFPERERGRAIGIWAAWSSIAAAVGPFLGGVLIDAWSWRAIFYLNLPAAAAALLLLRYRVPVDFPNLDGRRFDLIGGGIALAGMGILALGLTVTGIDTGSDGTVPATLILSGLVGLALFTLWEAGGAADPMMPVGLFGNRAFAGANAVTLLLYMALGGLFFLMPIALIDGGGRTAAQAGAVFLPFSLAMAVVARRAGDAVDRFGTRALLVAGCGVAALAFALLALAVRADAYLLGVLPVMAVLGAGMGLAVPPLSAAVLSGAPANRAGIASAVNNAVARFAGLVAVAALGGLATMIYRDTLAGLAPQLASVLARADFAAPVAGPADIQAIRAEAVRTAFAVLGWAAAGMAAAAGAVAAVALPAGGPRQQPGAARSGTPEPGLPPWRRIDLPDPLVDHERLQPASDAPAPPDPVEPRFTLQPSVPEPAPDAPPPPDPAASTAAPSVEAAPPAVAPPPPAASPDARPDVRPRTPRPPRAAAKTPARPASEERQPARPASRMAPGAAGPAARPPVPAPAERARPARPGSPSGPAPQPPAATAPAPAAASVPDASPAPGAPAAPPGPAPGPRTPAEGEEATAKPARVRRARPPRRLTPPRGD